MGSISDDAAARRTYWREEMEAGYRFMEAILAYPVEECGEGVVSLAAAAAGSGVEVAFAGTKVGGGYERLFVIREGIADDFVGAAREMNDRGWLMKVEDGYRTRAIQRGLGTLPITFDVVLKRLLWEGDGAIPSRELMFRRMTAVIATIPKIGTHMSASAMDISVLRREDGGVVDRGGPYIELSEKTPMASPFVAAAARANREAITAVMARHGFAAYPYEFWHYSQGDAYDAYLSGRGEPGRYGAVDVDLATGKVMALADPMAPLHSPQEIEARIHEALARLQAAERPEGAP